MKNKIADIYDSSAQGIEKKHIPELRFPEFTGEWEEKKLDDIIQIISPSKKLQSSEYLIAGTIPIIDQSQQFICGYTNDKEALLNAQQDNLIIFGDHTCCLKLINFPFAQGADGIKIFRSKAPTKIDTIYIYQQLLSQPLQTNEYKRHFSDLKKLDVRYPDNYLEQQKIANCLSSIDEQILATQQKWDSLKEYKRGLMQKLFPANGKTTPDFRFPEFANTGEWEEKKLGEVAEKKNTRNRNLFVSRVLSNSATEGIVDQNTYFGRNIAVKENTENYYVVDFNDFVYNPRISTLAPVGPISINKIGKGIMSPIYIIFRFKKGMFVDYWKHYFSTSIWHKYLKGIANFGARFDRMNITNEDFFNMPLLLPSLAEQEKIAECLSSIDEQILATQQKVYSLKEHKRGLMQRLFPNNNMDFKK